MDFPRSVPSVGLVDGKFADEDPLAGTPGSLIPSAWGNAVTEEILNVLREAELAPDEGDNTQLKAAIVSIIGNHAPTELAAQVEAETGTNNTKWMSPLRVFQAIAKVVVQATETVFGWAKVATQAQVATGTDDATIVTPKKLRAAQATQVEAETGTENSKIMTPLRVFQAIAKVVAQATETAFGFAKVATQSQANAGTDDATIVTPKKLAAVLTALLPKRSFTGNDFIRIPDVPGGLIIQWGRVSDDGAIKSFPTPFTAAGLSIVATIDNDAFQGGSVSAAIVNNSQFMIREGTAATPAVFLRYITIGF